MSMIVGDAASGTGMAGAIYAQITTLPWIQAGAAGQGLANAIAHAVVSYIQSNASVTGTVDPTGLLSPPMGGPVTGTATATGTVS